MPELICLVVRRHRRLQYNSFMLIYKLAFLFVHIYRFQSIWIILNNQFNYREMC